MRPDKLHTLRIDGVGASGEGVGRLEGRAVFVPAAIPGERWQIRLAHCRGRRLEAEPVRLLDRSPDRVEPVCPVFGRCGGCQLMHMAYPAQLELKQAVLADSLRSVAGIELEAAVPIEPAAAPLGYRNRGQYPVGRQAGRVVTGFFAPRSHDLVPVESCALHAEGVDRAVRQVRAWAGKERISIYDERAHRGWLRHVVARSANGELMVVLVGRAERRLAWRDLLRRLRRALPGLVGLVININPRRTNVVIGPRMRVLWGRPFVVEHLLGLRFRLTVGSFFQVHTAQAERLFEKLRRFAGRPAGPVVDAFCGVGVLAQILAADGHELVGIESAAVAVRDARESLRDNGLRGVRIVQSRVETALPRLVSSGLRPALVVLDPPRKGCHPAVLEAVARSGAQRVAYVSCHPGTLARDLARLAELGYRRVRFEAVDMFPQTAHLECFVGLERA
ncbi:MAG: 23S rRNA (uracil(1939)-C(5))-methyltransferase RlmD [Deltaproteobacteria bacterium]|nr:23S rRNA (uracil(1939)-C(5))-methyltransferase RlmD [Deltaproteobacteria bacterium]